MSGSRKFAMLAGCAALGGGVLGYWDGPAETRLTFLAVGQGDCAVFQTGGNTVLVDVGPRVKGFDAGKRIVMPELRRMGITSIDLIVLSHPDMDHVGGLAAVLRGMPVGRIAMPAGFQNDAATAEELRSAGYAPDRVLWLGRDQFAKIGSYSLQISCPRWQAGDNDNDGSSFVRIAGEGASAVLTGDAGSEAELEMEPRGDWSAQILKLGHHGSKTSTSESWLREVRPTWAVVSCGRTNSYGHPHPDVMERVEKAGIRVARTDREGAISFVVGPSGFQRE